jgi:hypothetical protein
MNMNEQYDPNTAYDLIDAEGIKVGDVRQGIYYEGTWEMGRIDGVVFHYNGEPGGTVEGLTVTRHDTDGSLTRCQLVPQETA